MRKIRLNRIRKRVTAINLQLLDIGLTNVEIMDFWEECQQEALIQHNLPPCNCKDVNQCDTWCQTKGRFVMNPPEPVIKPKEPYKPYEWRDVFFDD